MSKDKNAMDPSQDPNKVNREPRMVESNPERDVRATGDRSSSFDSRELSDEERLEIFRSSFVQASLPSLPAIPGWRVCWCSTTNERDTIPLRIAIGYVPVEPHEIRGWRGGNITTIESGDYAGWVSHNEMVAMKLPERLYARYMQEAHHHGPAAEEQKLVRQAEQLQQQAAADRAYISHGDGLELIKRESAIAEGKFA